MDNGHARERVGPGGAVGVAAAVAVFSVDGLVRRIQVMPVRVRRNRGKARPTGRGDEQSGLCEL